MSKLERALYELNRMDQTSEQTSLLHSLDARPKLLVTLLFLVCVLSLPANGLSQLIWFLIYPIVSCALAGISYGTVFRRSLIVLPFILFIGIFNPLLDRQVVFYVNGVGITSGWISFLSILIRGLVSMQAVLILILSTGFYRLCRGMQRLGVPALLTTQFLFVYRYIFVLLQEALSMERARKVRSFGRKSYPLSLWGTFIGQLLIRTIERSEHIHHAMLSRGFAGNMAGLSRSAWRGKDLLFLAAWSILFFLLRMFSPATLFQSSL